MRDKTGPGNNDSDDEIHSNTSFHDDDPDHDTGDVNAADLNPAIPTSATPTCPTPEARRRLRRRLMTSSRLQAALNQAGQLPTHSFIVS